MENQNKKIYWKGLEEFSNDIEFVKKAHNEFPEFLPIAEQNEAGGTKRRDFLKLLGFSVAAVSLAACEAPIKKSIPYLNKPEDFEPSIPNFYASTYAQDGEYASILVKTREGRPIKIDGNEASSITKGKVSARVLASILGLYDLSRIQEPREDNKKAKLEDVDAKIVSALSSANGTVYLVSHSILSPSTKAVIAEFTKKYPNVKHISYDAVSAYGMLKANQQSFGTYALPSYDFSKAETIVSISADFLGTWLSATEYNGQFAKNRKLNKNNREMSRLYTFESGMTITGANSDYRSQIKPSQEGIVAALLYNEIKGGLTVSDIADKKVADKIKQAAADLKAKKGKAVVIAGSNDPNVQLIVNAINAELGAYDQIIDLSSPSYLKQGNDEDMAKFVADVLGGTAGGAIFYGTNPAYDYPQGGEKFAKALKALAFSLSFSDRIDETSANCKFVVPDMHFLESWGDAEPRKGYFSFMQPTISPIYKGTRQAQDSLLKWSGSNKSYYDFLRSFWAKNTKENFNDFWTKALHEGVYESKNISFETTKTTVKDDAQVADKKVDAKTDVKADDKKEVKEVVKNEARLAGNFDFKGDVNGAAAALVAFFVTKSGVMELSLYQKVGLGSGFHGNNPWLQEMPDPITKATWDNYLCVSIADARDKYKQGDIVEVKANGFSVKVPVLIQPGQAKGTVSLALGYGRTSAGKCGDGVGKNAYPFATIKDGVYVYAAGEVIISKTEEVAELAITQTHQTIMGRNNVQESTLASYKKDTKAGRYYPMIVTADGKKKPTDITMWKGHEKTAYAKNHWWGMVVDLNSCTGCGACMIGCQSENNVSVVGKREVINGREMHWMRIDRYYSTDADTKDKSISNYQKMEEASENPEVVFQPMMCQHCNNAPCETVCPVLATTHSSEGLNQMTYNRCIGTRYCANNCPYKVRRFNWFNYTNDDKFKDVNYTMFTDLGRMVLNPDVTVRSRGVMEKCSLCVQRIQAGKLTARKDKRLVKDGDIKTACQTSCPTDAIIFGDMNDKDSMIAKVLELSKDEKTGDVVFAEDRAFHVLEEISVKPNVSYLTKIRNKA